MSVLAALLWAVGAAAHFAGVRQDGSSEAGDWAAAAFWFAVVPFGMLMDAVHDNSTGGGPGASA